MSPDRPRRKPRNRAAQRERPALPTSTSHRTQAGTAVLAREGAGMGRDLQSQNPRVGESHLAEPQHHLGWMDGFIYIIYKIYI